VPGAIELPGVRTALDRALPCFAAIPGDKEALNTVELAEVITRRIVLELSSQVCDLTKRQQHFLAFRTLIERAPVVESGRRSRTSDGAMPIEAHKGRRNRFPISNSRVQSLNTLTLSSKQPLSCQR